jgi:hypothetical protein
MKKKKQLIILGCVAVVVFLLLLALGFHFDGNKKPVITWEQFDRIQPGMTYDEVVAILGCTPGDHTAPENKNPSLDADRLPYYRGGAPVLRDGDGKRTTYFWSADGTSKPRHDQSGRDFQRYNDVFVVFNERGVVVRRTSCSSHYVAAESGFLVRLKKLFGL